MTNKNPWSSLTRNLFLIRPHQSLGNSNVDFPNFLNWKIAHLNCSLF